MKDRAPSPFAYPGVWDTATLIANGVSYLTPGACTVAPSSSVEIDENSVPGEDGNSPVLLGWRDADLSLTIKVWTDRQFAALNDLMTIFRPPQGKQNYSPVVLAHPAAQLLGVSLVYVLNVSAPAYSAEEGIFSLTMSLKQIHRKPAATSSETLAIVPGEPTSITQLSTVPEKPSSTPIPKPK